jgi:hypothetical protein
MHDKLRGGWRGGRVVCPLVLNLCPKDFAVSGEVRKIVSRLGMRSTTYDDPQLRECRSRMSPYTRLRLSSH